MTAPEPDDDLVALGAEVLAAPWPLDSAEEWFPEARAVLAATMPAVEARVLARVAEALWEQARNEPTASGQYAGWVKAAEYVESLSPREQGAGPISDREPPCPVDRQGLHDYRGGRTCRFCGQPRLAPMTPDDEALLALGIKPSDCVEARAVVATLRAAGWVPPSVITRWKAEEDAWYEERAELTAKIATARADERARVAAALRDEARDGGISGVRSWTFLDAAALVEAMQEGEHRG